MKSNSLEHARDLLQKGALHDAAGVCRAVLAADPQSSDAIHLLGLIQERTGASAEAESLLRQSVAAQPRRAEFRLNLGNFLRRCGKPADARAEYEALVGLAPDYRLGRLALMRLYDQLGDGARSEVQARELIRADALDAEAWNGLASALRAQRKPVEAESAYRQALSIRPRYGIARHNLGALLCQEQRAEEALAEIDQAARDGAQGAELHFNRGRALIDLQRFDEAEAELHRTVAQAPTYLDGQIALAQLRFCRGDRAFARDIIAAATCHRAHTPLQIAIGQLLRASGDLHGAHEWLEHALTDPRAAPAVRIELAGLLQEMGNVERSRATALDALRLQPHDRAAMAAAASALLGAGEANSALSLANEVLAESPFDQLFIAYRASAWRLLGDSRYAELYDYENLVRTFGIEAPPGWGDTQSFLNELREVLGRLHGLQSRPLDQSLRHGTQTPRSLLAERAPAIRALLAAFREALAAYQSGVGNESSHPVRARNVAVAQFSGCWSVRLQNAGYHVNHVHPQGWISSAFYVSVPAETTDPVRRSGWLKLGEPRFAFPQATAEQYVQPLPGRLVLFPSYMWHGTTPLLEHEARLSVAFDAIPMERQAS